MRAANMIKIELALPRLDHVTELFVKVQPIWTFGAKKLKLIALHLNERIIFGDVLFYTTERIIVAQHWILSKSKQGQHAEQQ